MIEKAGRRGQRDEAVENSRFSEFELKATSKRRICESYWQKERKRRKRPESK
jgi:hypothetical protein